MMELLTVPLYLSLTTLASDTSTLKNKQWKVKKFWIFSDFKKRPFIQFQALKIFFALLDKSMSSKF